MAQTTIAVVIPCLNDAELLDRCLGSLDRQTRRAEFVVVVDNGCTDESAGVAAEHGARVVVEPRRGITWAAATGYDAAYRWGAEFIVRTDADAWLPDDYLESLDRAWSSAPPGVVGVTGRALFDAAPRAVSRLYLAVYRWSVGSALGHPPFFGTNCSFRASWWSSVHGSLAMEDTAAHDDMQLSFAVRPGETVWFVPELVVGMDNRALRGRRQILRRLRRGWYTMMRGFTVSPPWRRLPERWARARAGTRLDL
ncbi:glycosyltransferase family 2 protein [Corynebacterium appendicis]|uniref:glycosyltransferase family 2 protein n=1 Tax=Corynebacterium appendicis TaxID=163202 RepID=UPI00255012B7|nr:glycosyltransferase family 2 protein [Corynebacterium appendicis]MDK8625917.1 glycosyltransferase [Corynebacterium appendicis]